MRIEVRVLGLVDQHDLKQVLEPATEILHDLLLELRACRLLASIAGT